MGGMAAQIPIKNDAAANEAAMDRVRADKKREAGDGHDGTWVAHPGLVAIAKAEFDAVMKGANQIARKRQDVHVDAADLIAMPEGTRTEAGLRQNVTGPGLVGPDGYRSTTAEELFADYPPHAIQVAGKTGTAQGRNSYPWNDSSAFAAFSVEPERPFTVVSYLEKAGYGSQGAAPGATITYTVQSGDTLSGIAKKFLGNANDYMDIFNANTDQLTDPDKIKPGQVLKIPQHSHR